MKVRPGIYITKVMEFSYYIHVCKLAVWFCNSIFGLSPSHNKVKVILEIANILNNISDLNNKCNYYL